jgi:hypothetical protein
VPKESWSAFSWGSPVLWPLVWLPRQADAILTGVDFVHPISFSLADQNATLAHIKAAGVRVIRFGMEDKEDENLDFIKRAYAQNIRVVLIFHGKYAPGAPVRPYRPNEFPGMWQGPPISSLDPELSRVYFQQFMDRLDAAGIALAGIELENEINMAGDNPDFRLPGEGRVLGLDDLYHDPEGQQVAKGYLQYLKVLAVLKDVRDHSKLSRHLVQEMMGDFRQLAQEKRLAGLIYYSWLGEARFDVYRCGSLTKTGQLAIAPITSH